MTKLELIRKAAREYDEAKASSIDSNNLRLINLVEKHGVEMVSAATGLKLSSIVQYTTRATAPQVSELAITKAESVLSQF